MPAAIRITLKRVRETKNYAVYQDVDNEINKLYLPKSTVLDTITLEQSAS